MRVCMRARACVCVRVCVRVCTLHIILKFSIVSWWITIIIGEVVQL